ncbi:MAG: alcohol dehydrogenase, partial [Acidobacteria bacterium]
MRAAVYHSNRDVRVVEIPRPVPGPGEILVRVRASGICGSDLMEWYRRPRAPLVLGHEVAGEVAQTGPGVRDLRRGDRVVTTHHVPCGRCRLCLTGRETCCPRLSVNHFDPGGFAEFVRVGEEAVRRGTFRLPPRTTFAEGSFVEPLACVLRAQRLAGLAPRDAVAMLGGGVSGLLHLLAAGAASRWS